MGRALARRPQAFLLDEPLSNLDAKLRTQLRAELKKIHQLVPTTSIYVTHDQVEAMTLGDRIAVMAEGRIQQLGVPQDVYDEPANLFVAGFIGSPAMNLMRGTVSRGELDAGPVQIPSRVREGAVVLGVRPEHLTVAGADGGDAATLELTVDVVEPLGNEVMVHGWVAAEPYVGGQTGLRDLGGEGRSAVTARLDPGVRTAAGETLRLAFDPAAVHVFDAETGMRAHTRLTLACSDSRSASARSKHAAPGTAALAVAAPRARASASSQSAPPALATTTPARKESPLPTG